MLTPEVYGLSRHSQSVTSELAKDPSQDPEHVFKRLYEHHDLHHLTEGSSESILPEDIALEFEKKDRLPRAYASGTWGSSTPQRSISRTNKVYHDALGSLENDPLTGVVSPPLMGSTGIVPLTIIAPLPDLCRHLGNCIARAEHEVFLGTNFWIHSNASTLVTNGIRELSRRAGERGQKIVMKMVYDRGNPRQVMENRLYVGDEERAGGKVRLPSAAEIPNVDLQVINFHRPIFGTFHAKFTVIDRRIALLQSSNIQDNDNLEMLSHIEGPIVDAFYDAALLSWGKPLNPPLPLLDSPARSAPIPSLEKPPKIPPRQPLSKEWRNPHPSSNTPSDAKDTTIQPDTVGNAPDTDQDPKMLPYILLPRHEPVPMALVNRPPYGAPNRSSVHNPQDAAFLSAISHAKHSIFIQTPNMNAEPLLEPLLDAVRRGVTVTPYLCLGYNDSGELLPFQNGTNEMIANRLYNALETDEEKARLRVHYYVGKDQVEPIHNSFKKRSCHIKLMIVDEQIAIQGNGNLDTQSFYHSQEINVLLDSPLICKAWLEAINLNQNTAKYGAASTKDGCWHREGSGEIPEGSIGIDPGRFSWAKGMIGAVNRVRGVGGF
ncbi:hypothetical protein N7468_007158 [Penicillium chermesinum]|uniref:PLD phosphodiesterase domain-containing protein n=1 Tax=Penicillium chermesinum TaxID=63820 RepID=A0A9W9TKE1_9EURO|nr:uncharacterized protein N7468_007158 [Penicillium chermesinum]KAJ5225933.1 hypothetical protein N7468_007158 [Penicillium chermesinum]